MNTLNYKISIGSRLISTLVIGLLWASPEITKAQLPVDSALGSYVVFTTTNQNSHGSAVILLAKTARRANSSEADTYGLSPVLTSALVPGDRGTGIVCPEATLLPGDLALSCSRTVRNPRGRPIFVETVLVGTSGSPFCEALRLSLPQGQRNRIVDETNENCDDNDEQCICYDIRWKGDAPVAPPSSGSGSGRRGP